MTEHDCNTAAIRSRPAGMWPAPRPRRGERITCPDCGAVWELRHPRLLPYWASSWKRISPGRP